MSFWAGGICEDTVYGLIDRREFCLDDGKVKDVPFWLSKWTKINPSAYYLPGGDCDINALIISLLRYRFREDPLSEMGLVSFEREFCRRIQSAWAEGKEKREEKNRNAGSPFSSCDSLIVASGIMVSIFDGDGFKFNVITDPGRFEYCPVPKEYLGEVEGYIQDLSGRLREATRKEQNALIKKGFAGLLKMVSDRNPFVSPEGDFLVIDSRRARIFRIKRFLGQYVFI